MSQGSINIHSSSGSLPTLTLFVNGKSYPIASCQTLFELLLHLGIDPAQKGIAVAVDDEVIRRQMWKMVVLSDGMRIEIIRAVQGG